MTIYKDLRYRVGATVGTAATGASQVLLKKVTASDGDATVSFDSSLITSDFNEYIFTFISIHPASDNVFWSFNASVDIAPACYSGYSPTMLLLLDPLHVYIVIASPCICC